MKALHALRLSLWMLALMLLASACSDGTVGKSTADSGATLDTRMAESTIAPASDRTGVVDLKDFDWAATEGKIVFLEFWGTWCGPCIRSMPTIQKHWEEHRDNPDFRMMAINTGSRGDDPAKIQRWREANAGFTFPVFLDSDRKMSTTYQVTGIPRSVVLGRDGKVAWTGHPMQMPVGLLDRLLSGNVQG
ncbi:MAG: TlpA family protein disulfide reductase [Calditrichaeota bacterium]|nr:TlpA family protein disulfide reductase [Calditrichota bacterium]MCB9472831.1 TlpA family protein disulfide reductase [Candidatus Delongbacteria bacterium]